MNLDHHPVRRLGRKFPTVSGLSFHAKTWLLLACLTGLLGGLFSAQAGVDIFMRVGGVAGSMGSTQSAPVLKGDSTDPQYTNWISVLSAQMGVGRGVSIASGGSATTTSSPSVSEITLTKLTDPTTPSFYSLVCGGSASVTQPIDYVTIDFRKSGTTQVFYRMQLQGVYISGVSTSGGTGSVPSESISLAFTKISWSYATYDSGGKASSIITKNYDLSTSKVY